MAQAVLTATGFKRKRFEDFIAEAEALAKQSFGANVNLDPKGPLGKFINNLAYARAEENELTEAVYNSGYVETAEGVSLDYAVKRGGMTRKQAAKATGTVTFTTTAGKVIGAGTIVATSGGVQYATIASVTATGTTVDAAIAAVLTGPEGNVPAGTITAIITAIAGVTAVTNAAATTGGRDQETDGQLRDRYNTTLAGGGKGTVDAIRAEIINTVANVRAAYVTENNLATVDGAGRPPHSFETTVLGGAAADIAAAILRSKAAGVRAYGTQSQTVNDSSGNPQTIGFSYASSASIYVNIAVSKNASFPQDGESLIKYQTINYIGGTGTDGTAYPGLGLGQTVVQSKIVAAILQAVSGINDLTVTLRKGSSGAFAASNIALSSTEVAETDAAKVVVTYV